MMMNWYENYRALPPGFKLDRLCGCEYWKLMFKSCIPDPVLDSCFGVGSFHSFLLHGPSGNGKLTLALALAKELYDAGYIFLRIPGLDLAGASKEEACKNIRELFDSILSGAMAENAAGCYLLVEEIQPLCKDALTARNFADAVVAAEDWELPVIVASTVEDFPQVPTYVRKVFVTCAIGLPDESDRRTFLENIFEDRIPRSSKLKYKDMTDLTEGFNYDQLTKLSALAGMLMKQHAQQLYGGDSKRILQALEQEQLFMTKDMFESMVGHLSSAGSGGNQVAGQYSTAMNGLSAIPYQGFSYGGGIGNGNGLLGGGTTGGSDYVSGLPRDVTDALQELEAPKDFMSAFEDMDEDAL